MQNELGDDFQVVEPQKRKPKVKIIAIGEEEMRLDDISLINTVKKQNGITGESKSFYMKVIKRILKKNREEEEIMEVP